MKINIKNTQAIEESLKLVNGRATAHTLRHARDLRELARQAESLLSLKGVAKKNFQGVVLQASPEGPSAAYVWKGKTTVVYLERGSKDWFLVGQETADLYPKQKETFILNVDKDAEKQIVAQAMLNISVRTE